MADAAAAPPLAVGTWLGIDYGEARVGVAVATFPVAIASPLVILPATPWERFWTKLDTLVREWQPRGVALGLPLSPRSDEPHPLAASVTAFAEALRDRYALPVALIDESLTSSHAERLLREAGKTRWQTRKQQLDAVAAALILQAFCDGQPPLTLMEP
ncbi:Holliday junction resolvase RuvX [Hydrogenophilus islandicus]